MGNKILFGLVVAVGVITAYVLIKDAKTNTDGIDAVKKIQTDKQAESKFATSANVSSEKTSTAVNNSNNKKMELEIKTTKEGTGDRVIKFGDTISVHYTGKLLDGTVFDSSVTRGTPFEFKIGQGMVIAGWEQGFIGAKVGEKRTLTIPAELGYGSRGAGASIPPNATLVFDVEVLDIK